MPIFELTRDAILPVREVTLAKQGYRERYDLQRVLRDQIEAVSPNSYVLAEEYSEWEDARRSIDLLCIDKDANLVVVELKRSDDGAHMELQAIRYAAMISKMTFAQAVDAHSKYLQRTGRDPAEAESGILHFLEWDEAQPEFGQTVRIVLVSAGFSKEITTSVIWLNDSGLDVQCVRLRPYELDGRTLLDIQQVLPLPEAEEYQVQLRRKVAEVRQARDSGVDWSTYNLTIDSDTTERLNKRWLFLRAIKALVAKGVSVDSMLQQFPARKFLGIPGKLTGSEFRDGAAQLTREDGSRRNLSRYFMGDDELFFSGEKTWALTNQWGRHDLPRLDRVISEHPNLQLRYAKAEDG
jgi:hypothetical protein